MIRLPLYGKAAIALSVTMFTFFASPAQDTFIEFGESTLEELKLKECAFDKNADAVVLLDHATAYFNDEHNLITERRIRLKILKEKGIQRGDIRIPYYSSNDFEFISNIEAMVKSPNDNGSFTTLRLEKKNIFHRQINSRYAMYSFALPGIKVGSIIDYKYRSQMKHHGGLRNWEFQSDIPVIVSSYELAPLPNSEFAYTVYKSSYFPIDVLQNKEAGKVKFTMKNIPGLRDEVYNTTTRNFLQRVNFQFASFKNYFGKTDYTNTWQQMATELLDEKSFGSQAAKDLSGTPFIKNLSPALSPTEKIKWIYDFVRTNITWNDLYSKYSEDGVKTTLEKKKGNNGEINLLLVSLLRSAGIETYPLLVSERDHGLIDTAYSYLDQFNKVVAYAFADGKAYTLDGTDIHTPFFLVPPDLLNTVGFIVDKKKRGFVYFNNLPQKQRELIAVTGHITDKGLVEGKANVSVLEYAKLAKELHYKTEKSRYLEALLKPHAFLKIDSFALHGLKEDSAALRQELAFHFDLKKTGGYYLLNYNLFTGLNENPFITQYRFTDIDFGSKYHATLLGSFFLPTSLATEALPANKKMVSPDYTMAVSRVMEKSESQINVKVIIEINREKYAADEYEDVKLFFKEMVNMLNEPILLKAN